MRKVIKMGIFTGFFDNLVGYNRPVTPPSTEQTTTLMHDPAGGIRLRMLETREARPGMPGDRPYKIGAFVVLEDMSDGMTDSDFPPYIRGGDVTDLEPGKKEFIRLCARPKIPPAIFGPCGVLYIPPNPLRD
jgi:hypothetical protein